MLNINLCDRQHLLNAHDYLLNKKNEGDRLREFAQWSVYVSPKQTSLESIVGPGNVALRAQTLLELSSIKPSKGKTLGIGLDCETAGKRSDFFTAKFLYSGLGTPPRADYAYATPSIDDELCGLIRMGQSEEPCASRPNTVTLAETVPCSVDPR